MSEEIVGYSFQMRGSSADGKTKIKASGTVAGPAGYPQAVFEAARKLVEDLFPGCTMEGDMPGVKAFPSLRQLKPKKKKKKV